MSVRRRQHAYSEADVGSFSSILQINDNQLGPGIRFARNAPVRIGRPVHPAITTFGPQTLVEFIRNQAGAVQPEEGSQETGDIQDLLARDALARESIQPARIGLAPNALQHLRSTSDTTCKAPDGSSRVRPADGSPKKRRSSRATRQKAFFPDVDVDTYDTASDRSSDPFLMHFSQPRRIPNPTLFRSSLPRSPPSTEPLSQPRFSRRRGRSGSNRSFFNHRRVPEFDDDDFFTTDLAIEAAAPVQVSPPTKIVPYEYALTVPTATPRIVVTEQIQHSSRSARYKRKRAMASLFAVAPGAPDDDDDDSDDSDDFDDDGSDGIFHDGSPNMKTLSISNDTSNRIWRGSGPPTPPGAPPDCPLPADPGYEMPRLPSDIWIAIASYLSLEDLHALRLVSRDISDEIPAIQFRNLVAPFGHAFRDIGVNAVTSVLAKYGGSVGKFGISFEYDAAGLAFASPKTSLKTEHAWYGSYQWPAQQYYRYDKLRQLEDLVDNNTPLLKDVFSHLSNTHELGLSIDSGHGWLEGPDISDMALFKLRQTKGTKVFGQTFENEHLWQAYGRDEYFKWAQQNTINKLLTHLASKPGTTDSMKMLEVIQTFEIRDRDTFTSLESQPDYNPDCHTGGRAGATGAATGGPGAGPGQGPGQGHLPVGPPVLAWNFNAGHLGGPPVFPGPPGGNLQQLQAQQQQALQAQMQLQAQVQAAWQGMQQAAPLNATHPVPTLFGSALQGQPRSRRNQRGASTSTPKRASLIGKKRKIPLQWPLIFNGYNLAAESGGCLNTVQANVAHPSEFPLLPGCLTESQVQWLMETVWAQRTFLSAYTSAIISNASKLRHLHTLTISKLSSGLLPSLAQPKFWDALPNLRRLTLLVSPDWRKEHHEQDVYIQRASLISPLDAVGKFCDFLRTHVCRLEKLYRATFGWAGGGEHAVGICARNQNLLPAPIIRDVGAWVSDHDAAAKGDPDEMLRFEHLCDLTFENCWFSPYMLETFMRKSHDTSLRTLTMNSVSMLARHSPSTQQQASLTTVDNGLACAHEEENWLQEELPASATWAGILDRITPGKTLEELKYDANLIDKDEHPMPQRTYRGSLQRIVLKSCGYAYVNMPWERFHQRDLVMQPQGSVDQGLSPRESQLRGRHQMVVDSSHLSRTAAAYGNTGAEINKNDRTVDLGPIMLSNYIGFGAGWRGLGTLTQCIHPIEKRILEHAWGMKFGWEDNLERWAAVEDNQLEGGTGRFSGVLTSEMHEDDI